MDAGRFDALTRWLTDPASRRAAVGVSLGSILGARGFADSDAKKRKKKCKKKCGPCRKCKKGKCKPKPNGTSCGICQACTSGQCLNAPDNAPCDDGNPCTINDICTNGVCGGISGNQGQVCGTSTNSGTAIRCCNGICPDPNCVPSGPTSVSCDALADCLAIDCCSDEVSDCGGSDLCICFFAEPGEPCGSDQDCASGLYPETACICGTCQLPPP